MPSDENASVATQDCTFVTHYCAGNLYLPICISASLILLNLFRELNLRRKTCQQPLDIHTILGKPLGKGKILYYSLQHHAPTSTAFLVLEGSTADIILGCPWLTQHSPMVDWNTGEILQWSEYCLQNCVSSVPKSPEPPSSSITKKVTLYSTSFESPETSTTPTIPPYSASRLLPHWPWDCTIDLLPGAKLQKGRIYPLFFSEQKAMEE